MGKRLGRRIPRAEQELDAPVIRARRVYYTAGDKPTQYLVGRYHPDRHRFIVDLMPRAGTTTVEAVPDPATTKTEQQEEKA